MIQRIALFYVLTALCVACRYEPPANGGPGRRVTQRTVWVRTDLSGKRVRQKFVLQPQVLSRCEAGTRLSPDNLVAEPASKFKKGEPVYLSMWLAEAPEGLQVSLRVLDANEDEIGTARRDDAGGLKAVTLHVGEELEPGRYKLEGFWGGNLVCEKWVEVTGT